MLRISSNEWSCNNHIFVKDNMFYHGYGQFLMTKVICSLRVLREQAIEFRIDLIPGTLTNLYPSLSIIMIVQEGLKKQMDDMLSKDLIQCGLTPWKHIYSQP